MKKSWTVLAVALGLLAAACQPSAQQPSATPTVRLARPSATRPAQPSPSATLSPTPPPSATPRPVGPAYFPGYNPLTGLPIGPGLLRRAPLLVSITNFPPSARPQAGLSQADHVWETSIGQGLTRFLAVYFGDYPQRLSELAPGADLPYDFVIGPIRSGRVVFDDIRAFYPGGLIVTRAASAQVLPELGKQLTVNALNPDDVNSAGLRLADLPGLPLDPAQPASHAGLSFDHRIPAGGSPGLELSLIYNLFAQFQWTYDSASGRYLRWQDMADGNGQLGPQIDRLTGQQLAFDNLVVLFADHKLQNLEGTIIEIELRFVPARFGLVFRDGRRYPITWSSERSALRLFDEDGRPLALKPGRTFFEVFGFESTWDGESVVRYHSPPLPTLTITPTFTVSPTVTVTPTETGTATPEP
jgi:hypothetical protein